MSIASEITRLQQAKSDLATSIENKGVTVPAATTLDGYAALVDQIQQGGGLLDYSQIEYIKGDGNAYLEIPFSGSSRTTTLSLDFIASSIDSDMSLLGSRTASNTRFCWIMSPTATATQVGYGSTFTNLSIAIAIGDVVNCTTSISGSTITYTVSNITKGTTQSTSWALSNFSVNSFVNLFWSGALNKSKVSVTGLWIANNGTKMVDCIPLRVGQTGYMYDKISGNLLGNKGTGNFILGADKN